MTFFKTKQNENIPLSKSSFPYFLVSCFFFCSISVVNAQSNVTTETITQQEETGFFEDQQFVSASDFVFQTFEETKSMFKIDLRGILFNPPSISANRFAAGNYIGIDFEQKLNTAFSINTSAAFYFLSNQLSLSRHKESWQLGLNFEVQPRWYYNMKKKVAKGESANNLSGNYIGFNSNFRYEWLTNSDFDLPIVNLGLKYGIQRRIFGRGFIDISTGPSLWFQQSSVEWSFNTQIRLGLTLGTPKLDPNAKERCDVFQCFEERKHLFKIDLINALIINGDGQTTEYSGSLFAAFERKMGSYWSINTEVEFSYISLGLFSNNRFSNMSISLKTQARYYYNLKKRIAEGKSANNLSGNYVGWQVQTSPVFQYRSSYSFRGDNWVTPNIAWTFAPIWGIQRTIFKRGFIDYSLGLRLFELGENQTDYYLNERPLFHSEGFHINPISQLRIGLAF